MAGFVVEAVAGGENFAGPLKLVDLGECEEVKSRAAGRARAAWARWRDSRQLNLIETSDRLLLIEGQPDRPPAADEALQRWLDGRGGSFRGFQPARIPLRQSPGADLCVCRSAGHAPDLPAEQPQSHLFRR
jgi:hypothetical protein